MAERWAVVIDAATMDASHGFIVEAEDESEAVLKGARLAVLADRLGAGMAHVPEGEDVATYEMPVDARQRQADDDELIQAVECYGVAARLREHDAGA